MFFIDGLGLGANNDNNPLVKAKTPAFNKILAGADLTREFRGSGLATMIPTDATLGLTGLPQSATGQTAILTGVNAAKEVGRHVSGFPTFTLKKIIKEESLLKKLKQLGLKVNFFNTYSERDYLETARYYSATTLATLAAGMEFNYLEDLLAGRSIYHDLTQQSLIKKGYEVPLVSARDSALRVQKAIKKYDFILIEYFLSDIKGHKQDLSEAIQVIEDIDEFLLTLLTTLNWEETLLIITSDHGNIEDLSIKTHTKNLVPTILIGKAKEKIQESIQDLTDLAPLIVELFTKNRVHQ